jgi:hypothetical protein
MKYGAACHSIVGWLHLGIINYEGEFLVTAWAALKLCHAVHPVTEIHGRQPCDCHRNGPETYDALDPGRNRHTVLVYFFGADRSPSDKSSALCGAIENPFDVGLTVAKEPRKLVLDALVMWRPDRINKRPQDIGRLVIPSRRMDQKRLQNHAMETIIDGRIYRLSRHILDGLENSYRTMRGERSSDAGSVVESNKVRLTRRPRCSGLYPEIPHRTSDGFTSIGACVLLVFICSRPPGNRSSGLMQPETKLEASPDRPVKKLGMVGCRYHDCVAGQIVNLH